MRRITYGIIGGSIAFALTAASAIGTGIVLNSVEDVRGVTSDTITVSESLCDGNYNIQWTEAVSGNGQIDGATAERSLVPADPADPTLPFCANAPASLEIYDGAVGTGSLVAFACDFTDANGDADFASLTGTDNFGNTISPIIEGGWGVRLTIGDYQNCGGAI